MFRTLVEQRIEPPSLWTKNDAALPPSTATNTRVCPHWTGTSWRVTSVHVVQAFFSPEPVNLKRLALHFPLTEEIFWKTITYVLLDKPWGWKKVMNHPIFWMYKPSYYIYECIICLQRLWAMCHTAQLMSICCMQTYKTGLNHHFRIILSDNIRTIFKWEKNHFWLQLLKHRIQRVKGDLIVV